MSKPIERPLRKNFQTQETTEMDEEMYSKSLGKYADHLESQISELKEEVKRVQDFGSLLATDVEDLEEELQSAKEVNAEEMIEHHEKEKELINSLNDAKELNKELEKKWSDTIKENEKLVDAYNLIKYRELYEAKKSLNNEKEENKKLKAFVNQHARFRNQPWEAEFEDYRRNWK